MLQFRFEITHKHQKSAFTHTNTRTHVRTNTHTLTFDAEGDKKPLFILKVRKVQNSVLVKSF